MKDSISSIKKQLTDLHQVIQDKIDERRRLTEEIDAINAAPPDQQAVVDLLTGFIDERADSYPSCLKHHIQGFLNNWRKGDFIKQQDIPLLHTSVKPTVTELGVLPPPNGLYYLLRDTLKAAVTRAVSEMDVDWTGGLSTAERLKKLTALNNQLQVVDSELRSLYDDCSGLGITLPNETLSAEEKEARRRVALVTERLAKEPRVEVIDACLPGDEDFHLAKPRHAL